MQAVIAIAFLFFFPAHASPESDEAARLQAVVQDQTTQIKTLKKARSTLAKENAALKSEVAAIRKTLTDKGQIENAKLTKDLRAAKQELTQLHARIIELETRSAVGKPPNRPSKRGRSISPPMSKEVADAIRNGTLIVGMTLEEADAAMLRMEAADWKAHGAGAFVSRLTHELLEETQSYKTYHWDIYRDVKSLDGAGRPPHDTFTATFVDGKLSNWNKTHHE